MRIKIKLSICPGCCAGVFFKRFNKICRRRKTGLPRDLFDTVLSGQKIVLCNSDSIFNQVLMDRFSGFLFKNSVKMVRVVIKVISYVGIRQSMICIILMNKFDHLVAQTCVNSVVTGFVQKFKYAQLEQSRGFLAVVIFFGEEVFCTLSKKMLYMRCSFNYRA